MVMVRECGNYRVEVTPRRLGDLGGVHMSDSMVTRTVDLDYRTRCRQIAEAIKRHVDNVADATVVWDERLACSFCGLDWEDPEDLPMCCGEAQDEWKAKQEEVTGEPVGG